MRFFLLELRRWPLKLYTYTAKGLQRKVRQEKTHELIRLYTLFYITAFIFNQNQFKYS
jgi:hypothetical protein